MKMKTIITVLFILLAHSLRGQNNLIITGQVTDTEKSKLTSATVRYYVEDSTFIKGCITDANGDFKLQVPQTDKVQRLVFSYLGYKELAIKIQPTKERTIRLGDIVMKKDVMQIQEVTVLSENQVRTEDKLMVYPTKEELRHAYDGYSALDVLMVPGLNVNTFNNSINYMSQTVLLCINGREATQDEVRDLNAKYIKRVDIYPKGKAEFPQAGAVIDYVMKERDYAGTTAFNTNHDFTSLKGNGRISTQYFQGKSEFAVSVSGGYNNNNWKDEGYMISTYNFPNETVTRTLKGLRSDINAGNLNGYVNYIYNDKVQNFYVSFRMNHNDSEQDDRNSLQYSNNPTLLTMQEHKQIKKLNPGLKLQYTRTLPHDQRLRAEFYGSYGNNDYDRWYEYSDDGVVVDAYRNSTAEESYYGSGKVNYTKTFRNKSSLNIDLSQDFTHTANLNLRGGNTYNVSLDKSNTYLNATYNYRIKKRLNLQARIAGHISHVETSGNEVTNLFLTPSLRLSYMYKNHSFNLQGEAKSCEVSNSNRTGDEYRNNEYEITQGNPDLKDYMNYNVSLFYTWNINKYFTWLCYGSLNLNTNYIYKKCTYDADRNAIIWRVQNSGTNWLQHYETALQWNIIPKRLYIRTGLLYDYTKIKVWETIYHHTLYGMGHVVYQNKGLRARIGFLTQPKYIDSQTGRITRNPVNIDMSASYSIDNWNFRIAYCNPYSFEGRDEIDLGIYKQYVVNKRHRFYDNWGILGVSYRFNYGKKKHKFDNTQVIDVNKTTISEQ